MRSLLAFLAARVLSNWFSGLMIELDSLIPRAG